MLLPHQLLTKIKKASWDSRVRFQAENPGGEFLNAYSLYATLQKPKDWYKIAKDCSEKPSHQHFGKTPEEILEIWNTKKDKKAYEGNTLDDYIKLKSEGNDIGGLLTFKQKEIDKKNFDLVQKCDQFDKLHNDLLKKLTYINSEIWLTSDIGLNLRCDSLFTIPDVQQNVQHAVIMEWKSLDNLEMSNHWNKLIGPLDGLDDCDAVKFTLQTHLYRYIIERYNIFPDAKVMTNIYNFNTLAYQKIQQQFPYSVELVEQIIEFAKLKVAEKKAKEQEELKAKSNENI